MDLRVIILLITIIFLELPGVDYNQHPVLERNVPDVLEKKTSEGSRGVQDRMHALINNDAATENVLFSYGPIPINLASKELLSTIDGVGPILSEKIVRYRNKNGAFSNKDDLLEIKGLGAVKLKKLEKHLLFGVE